MAPRKRKRSNTKQVKSSSVVPESDNFVIPGDDDSDVPLARVSSTNILSETVAHENEITEPEQIPNLSTNVAVDTDEYAVVNVKKPRLFKLRSDSDLAKPIQTARPTRGMPRIKSQSHTTKESSTVYVVAFRFSPHDVGTQRVSYLSASSTEGDSDFGINDNKDRHSFSDSDIDNSNESGDDSDAMHSTHSLKSRNSTNVLTNYRAKETKTTYLDSFPEITDSGVTRNKDIQNNPLILEEEDIDPLLREEHKTLPTLRQVSMHPTSLNASVIQFVRFGQPQPEPGSNVALGYEKVVLNMVAGPEGKRQLTAAVKFTHTLPFLNPSRASPNLVAYDAGKICFKGENSKQGRNAVFLTTGLVVESQLKNPTDSSINASHKIRQVVLLPFAGEVQRLLAYIGTVFETDEYLCLLDSGSLLLTTRREGAGADYNNSVNYASSSSSPSRTRVPAGLLTSSPVKLGSSPNPNKGKSTHFPPSLGFKDNVPVYDVRKRPEFMFDKEGLKNITDLPIYKNGKTDIPPCKYIATVGYTVGSWKTRASADDDTIRSCASLNIQFIIILGKVDVKDLA
ncbi:hypothetical protein F5887DRAFT_1081410 [Amanita rubescens]|nr:hypothetical protein F5887DRAFT_1082624 [Amanita rubescens]KAF8330971.1 hypothetical protein F5887DRAFT_1081410 [Amanita rubescens]